LKGSGYPEPFFNFQLPRSPAIPALPAAGKTLFGPLVMLFFIDLSAQFG
jgi:hypothetical protein